MSMLLYKDEAFEDRWTTVPSLTLDDDIFVKVFMVKDRRIDSVREIVSHARQHNSVFGSIPIFGLS